MSLTAHRLTRRFGARVAVDDVSFSLAPGEVFALLGPNGAGKTTTLRMLAGLIEPTSGHVTIGTEALSRRNASRLRSRIGFLTEMPGLWDRLSVRRNLLVYAQLHQLPRPDAAVDEALDLLGVRDRAADVAAQLSKGLRQRVALARTLLHRPAIVLLDEPTAGLDPGSARDMRDLIVRLRGEGRTVLLSTHNLDEVERVADRVAVLRTSLVAVDSPTALRAHLFGSRVRVVLKGPGDAFAQILANSGATDVQVDGRTLSIAVRDHESETPALVRLLVEAGAEIISVGPEQPRLEDVYLRLLEAHANRGTAHG